MFKVLKPFAMNREKNKNTLACFVPAPSLDAVFDIIVENKIHLNIKRARSTKLGDFRPPTRGMPPRLSINGDLNPYAFLITLLHEIAHWLVWQNYSNYQDIAPHGLEWKRTYKALMEPFLNENIFPGSILTPLKKHMKNPKASSSSDIQLQRAIKVFNTGEQVILLADLKEGDSFVLRGRQFVILKKNRTRFLCKDLLIGSKYMIHGLAEIEPLN